MKRRATKLIVATLIGAGTVGLADVAYAGYFDSEFDEIMAVGQFPAWTSAQTKAETSRPGFVHINSVGADYSVDVQQCENVPISCGGKVYGLKAGSEASLANTVQAGSQTRLQLQSGSWNSVKVEVAGFWHSN